MIVLGYCDLLNCLWFKPNYCLSVPWILVIRWTRLFLALIWRICVAMSNLSMIFLLICTIWFVCYFCRPTCSSMTVFMVSGSITNSRLRTTRPFSLVRNQSLFSVPGTPKSCNTWFCYGKFLSLFCDCTL